MAYKRTKLTSAFSFDKPLRQYYIAPTRLYRYWWQMGSDLGTGLWAAIYLVYGVLLTLAAIPLMVGRYVGMLTGLKKYQSYEAGPFRQMFTDFGDGIGNAVKGGVLGVSCVVIYPMTVLRFIRNIPNLLGHSVTTYDFQITHFTDGLFATQRFRESAEFKTLQAEYQQTTLKALQQYLWEMGDPNPALRADAKPLIARVLTDTHMVQLLIQAGAEVNVKFSVVLKWGGRDKTTVTLLQYAFHLKAPDAVVNMIAGGSDKVKEALKNSLHAEDYYQNKRFVTPETFDFRRALGAAVYNNQHDLINTVFALGYTCARHNAHHYSFLPILHYACAEFNLGDAAARRKTLELIIKQYQQEALDLNTVVSKTTQGNALQYASREGNLLAVKRLLAQPGIQLDPQDRVGITPLHAATTHGHPEVVRALLEAGADASIASDRSVTPVTPANVKKQLDADQAQFDECKQILKEYEGLKDFIPISAKIIYKISDTKPLNALEAYVKDHAENFRVDLMVKLPTAIVTLEAQKVTKASPLMIACHFEKPEFVEFLLKQGANPLASNGTQIAKDMTRVPAIHQLLDDYQEKQALTKQLLAEAKDGNFDNFTRENIEKIKPYINQTDDEQRTLLQLAIAQRKVDIVRLLVEAGNADVTYPDTSLSPMNTACFILKDRLLPGLYDYLNQLNQDNHADTLAQAKAYFDIIVYLSTRGVEVYRGVVLCCIALFNHDDQATADLYNKLLLVTDVDKDDAAYQSVLHFACANVHDNPHYAKVLLNLQDETWKVDNDQHSEVMNYTPLHITAMHGKDTIADYLLTQKNAPVAVAIPTYNEFAVYNAFPVTLALRNGHHDLAMRLFADDVKAEYTAAPINNRTEFPEILFAACETGNEPAVLRFFELFGDDWAQNISSWLRTEGRTPSMQRFKITPLHAACTNSKTSNALVAALLDHKAQINLRKNFSKTSATYQIPAVLLASQHNEDVAVYLVEQKAIIPYPRDYPSNALWNACAEGFTQLATVLLTTPHCQAAIERAIVYDVQGITPLLAACRRGMADVVRELISQGASCKTAVNSTGNTALHIAFGLLDADTAKVLIPECHDAKKMITSATNEAGKTPLQLAQAALAKEGVTEEVKQAWQAMLKPYVEAPAASSDNTSTSSATAATLE